MSTNRVALAQMTSTADVAANLACALTLLEEAAAGGAGFLAYPEVFACIAGRREKLAAAEALYPWGSAKPDAAQLNFGGEIAGNVRRTVNVGSYPLGQSPSGICDLAGNAWEWTADWYGPYPERLVENPKGPLKGYFRISRGGSWFHGADAIRGASRNADNEEDRSGYTGFRLVLDIPPEELKAMGPKTQ